LRATEAAPRSSLNDLAGTPADRLIEVHGIALDLDWLKLPPAEGFAELAALPAEAKQGPAACDPVGRLLAADRRQLLGPGQ
jgi:hypothetical protein